MAIQLTVRGVGQERGSGAPLVVLREKAGERYLVIAIGPLELTAIALAMGDAPSPPPRPLTHDLLMGALAACGARVTHALIHGVIGGVFHARLALDVAGRHAELEARASDAIAVALRAGIPIHAEEAVLAQAGITAQLESPTAGESNSPAGERIREDQLGAFRDVIRGLDLDDLGHPGTPG